MALFTDKQLLILGGVAALGLFVAYRKGEQLAAAVDPTDPANVFHTVTNDIGAALTGKQDFSLGIAVYDALNWTRGIWGESDQDRYREAERIAKAQYQALQQSQRSIGM